MDWRSVTFDWNRARAFLVTAEEGSFSAAARALGLSQPTVGRQVAALEEELDVSLFERVGHGLILTPSGLELVDHVRTMGEAATRISRVAAGHATTLEGTVILSASEAISTSVLPPILTRLRAEHPKLVIDVVASNVTSDLRRREADIALRNFRPTDPELVARKVAVSQARLYATPSYLAAIGDPTSPSDLAGADFVGFSDVEVMRKGLAAMGLPLTAEQFRLRSDSHLVQWSFVRQGLGIGIMMEQLADPDPTVVRAVPDFPPIPFPTWLTAHRDVRTGRRIRVVYDLLADLLPDALSSAHPVEPTQP